MDVYKEELNAASAETMTCNFRKPVRRIILMTDGQTDRSAVTITAIGIASNADVIGLNCFVTSRYSRFSHLILFVLPRADMPRLLAGNHFSINGKLSVCAARTVLTKRNTK